MLKLKVQAEDDHATAQWKFSEKPTIENRNAVLKEADDLYNAKNNLAKAKKKARAARKIYQGLVAGVNS